MSSTRVNVVAVFGVTLEYDRFPEHTVYLNFICFEKDFSTFTNTFNGNYIHISLQGNVKREGNLLFHVTLQVIQFEFQNQTLKIFLYKDHKKVGKKKKKFFRRH